MNRTIKYRIKAAWNVLRGRPTIAFVPHLPLAEELWIDRRWYVVGTTLMRGDRG